MVTTSAEQQANIDKYNSLKLARDPAWVAFTDQYFFDSAIAAMVTTALQPLLDDEIRQKESELAKLDPVAKANYDVATAQIDAKAKQDKQAALDAALSDKIQQAITADPSLLTKAEAAVESTGIKPDDPTLLQRAKDWIAKFIGV